MSDGVAGMKVDHVHEAPTSFIKKYVFSLDHKIIGIQYFMLALFSVLIGIVLSLLIRIRLVWPEAKIPGLEALSPNGAPDGVMTPEYYLSLLTIHGTIMVFFVLTTAPQGGFGNYFLPIQIGAEDMAFPRLNMLSFWITFVGLLVLLSTFFITDGPPISGWTAYPPLSAVGSAAGPGLQMGQILWVGSIACFCIAALLGSLNFIVTIMDLRAEGMTLGRLPLPCWAWFITAILGLLAFAVLLAAGVLLLLEKLGGTSFFIPSGLIVSDKIIERGGGSPLLWQHLFWFFGHPEVYIAILPGMGVVSQILSTFSRKPIFGYRAMVIALTAIAFLGFCVWGHHMFISGMSPYSSFAFSIMTAVIAVPSAIKTFNWLGTLWGGKLRMQTPLLFSVGFVSLFITGGLGGIFLAQPALDIYFHDTYFVVGHFHMIMGVAAIFGIFAGTYYWFPKMFGRLMNERMGKIHFITTFIGVYAIYVPMHLMGLVGHPRRYADLTGVDYLSPLIGIHTFISIAAFLTAAVQIIFIFNFFWSIKKGEKSSDNPWEATTLEWSIPSPPPHDNFGGKVPRVYHGPYEYSVPGAKTDYIMQTSSEETTG